MTAIAVRPTPTPTPSHAAAQSHWLARAAEKAGLPGASTCRLPAGILMADAWDVVARATGLSVRELSAAVAPGLRVSTASIEAADPKSLRLVPERVARKHRAFPLREDDRTITVATADPFDFSAEQEIAFASGRNVKFELCPPHLIDEAIASHYSPDRAVEALLGSAITSQAADDLKVIGDETAPVYNPGGSGPVIQLTNHIISTAVRQRASDIHIEPGPRAGTVRFRIDGVMRHHLHAPMPVLTRVVARIKVMARLDIADRLRPQDGRARLQVDGIAIDLRVSTVPTRDAEKAVIRLLRTDTAQTLDQLGALPSEIQRIRHLIRNRDGIVIVTGPTGSGKTTTLYSAIREVADGNVNVMTVEDPIEYEVPGITQMQVETKRGVTFATALRAILRQDPDVIFVGEIRDLETATIAVQAAMTGHLVLATLHANDAIGAIARLEDLGLDRPSIAATFRGSVAQRLVRRTCPDCVHRIGDQDLTPDEQRLSERFGARPTVRAMGCARCGNTGYCGRIPIHEIASVTPDLVGQIASGAHASALNRVATAAGMRSLHSVALEIAAAGNTTLAEIERVLGETEEPLAQAGAPPVAGSPALVKSDARTILIVDDDPVQRLICESILKQQRYAVVSATDGLHALEVLQTRKDIDLIVTDLHMPRLDGTGLVAGLKGSAEHASLPIIVLTGSGDEGDDEVRLMDLGADDYLRKPVEPSRLIARARAALRRAGADGR